MSLTACARYVVLCGALLHITHHMRLPVECNTILYINVCRSTATIVYTESQRGIVRFVVVGQPCRVHHCRVSTLRWVTITGTHAGGRGSQMIIATAINIDPCESTVGNYINMLAVCCVDCSGVASECFPLTPAICLSLYTVEKQRGLCTVAWVWILLGNGSAKQQPVWTME